GLLRIPSPSPSTLSPTSVFSVLPPRDFTHLSSVAPPKEVLPGTLIDRRGSFRIYFVRVEAIALPMDVTDTSEQPAKSSKDEPDFDPSRMIGIIKRKALIKELAAAYHAECLACCQKLLQLQRKWEEEQQYIKRKTPQESGKHTTKPSKRPKKGIKCYGKQEKWGGLN
ncbi:unnamed protein product, partial [Musa hybrid cultivar]